MFCNEVEGTEHQNFQLNVFDFGYIKIWRLILSVVYAFNTQNNCPWLVISNKWKKTFCVCKSYSCRLIFVRQSTRDEQTSDKKGSRQQQVNSDDEAAPGKEMKKSFLSVDAQKEKSVDEENLA